MQIAARRRLGEGWHGRSARRPRRPHSLARLFEEGLLLAELVEQRLVRQLHKILKPFMLRRLKADVAKSLPKKKETVLYVGLSQMQRDLYKRCLLRDMDVMQGASRERVRAGAQQHGVPRTVTPNSVLDFRSFR